MAYRQGEHLEEPSLSSQMLDLAVAVVGIGVSLTVTTAVKVGEMVFGDVRRITSPGSYGKGPKEGLIPMEADPSTAAPDVGHVALMSDGPLRR